MRIIENYEKKREALALLLELSLDYHKVQNRAFHKMDFEKAKEYIGLEESVNKIMEHLEKYGA